MYKLTEDRIKTIIDNRRDTFPEELLCAYDIGAITAEDLYSRIYMDVKPEEFEPLEWTTYSQAEIDQAIAEHGTWIGDRVWNQYGCENYDEFCYSPFEEFPCCKFCDENESPCGNKYPCQALIDVLNDEFIGPYCAKMGWRKR